MKPALISCRVAQFLSFSLLFLAANGCTSPKKAHASKVPESFSTEFHRDSSTQFTPEERRLITIARHHLEQTDKKPNDVYYRVRPKENGSEVFVLYVTKYENNRPVFLPCNDVAVLLDRDGKIQKVLTGPAAWP
jgi:hypothetical protein